MRKRMRWLWYATMALYLLPLPSIIVLSVLDVLPGSRAQYLTRDNFLFCLTAVPVFSVVTVLYLGEKGPEPTWLKVVLAVSAAILIALSALLSLVFSL